MRSKITIWQKENITKLAEMYNEIDQKPVFITKNGRVYAADRLSMNGKEYSEMATALSDLGKKLITFMKAIKYVQETLGDDYMKLIVEEYG